MTKLAVTVASSSAVAVSGVTVMMTHLSTSTVPVLGLVLFPHQLSLAITALEVSEESNSKISLTLFKIIESETFNLEFFNLNADEAVLLTITDSLMLVLIEVTILITFDEPVILLSTIVQLIIDALQLLTPITYAEQVLFLNNVFLIVEFPIVLIIPVVALLL